MNDLQKLKNWLATYPGADLMGTLQVDYTDRLPGSFGVFPAGLIENSREENIWGDVTVNNTYNFALYAVFEKSPGDDVAALANADWVMDLQKWVQAQSISRKAPTFGNIDQNRETISAQNGALLEADGEGAALYLIQLAANFRQFCPGT